MPTGAKSAGKERLALLIVLESPPRGVDFGVQDGKGSSYRTVERVRSVGRDVLFACSVEVRRTAGGVVDYAGSVVQGPAGARFIYLDVGKLAGQEDSRWE